MTTARRKHDRGFTLIEALLAAAILAMAVTGILMPFTAGAQNEQTDASRTLALSLAQEMMEEILARPFCDPDGDTSPGPDANETSRASFDCIDDYDGFNEPAGQIAAPDGEIIDGSAATGLSRHVKAAYVHVNGQDTSEAPTFIRVTVEVRYRGSPVIVLTRLVYALH